jgi:hypothetical protein
MSEATPEDHKGRLNAMEKARQILSEHFDMGFIVVSHEESGTTKFAKTEWGNAFGLIQLSKDFADGSLETDNELELEEEED